MTDKIKCKRLYNKATHTLELVREISHLDLQFESQDIETKKHFRKAIDELKAFIDNIS